MIYVIYSSKKYYFFTEVLNQNLYKQIWKKLCNAGIDLVEHDGIEHAGYLAFLLILGIFPFLTFTAALVGIFGDLYTSTYFDHSLITFLTNIIMDSAFSPFISSLKPRLIEISSTPPKSFVTIAILSAVWTASSIFEGLRTILNRAYRVHYPPPYIWRRLLSIVEFFMVLFVVLVSIIFLELLPNLLSILRQIIADHEYLSNIAKYLGDNVNYADEIRSLILLLIHFFMISYIYYFLPSIKPKFIHTFPGTCITISGWMVFSQLFSYYISTFPQINLIYGSIAGVVITLLSFYMCAVLFIYGAELNYHMAKSMQ